MNGASWVVLEGFWGDPKEVEAIFDAISSLRTTAGWTWGTLKQELAPGGALLFARESVGITSAWTHQIDHGKSRVRVFDHCFDGAGGRFVDIKAYAIGTLVHELAHVWDISHGLQLSFDLLQLSGGTYFDSQGRARYVPRGYGRNSGTTRTGHVCHEDDFAESVAAVVCGQHYDEGQGGLVDATRIGYVRGLMSSRNQ